MKFSIVIPNYNKGQYIAQTIGSVLAQNYEDFEVIIVDDSSTDNSWEIISAYNDRYDKIRAYKPFEQNKGGSACRNYGWQQASGDLIMFLDSDDLLAEYCLSRRIAAILDQTGKEFWVFSTGTFYKKPGDSNSCWRPKGSSFLLRFLAHELPWNVMSVVWKLSCLKELNGFDEAYPRLQDVELHTRALIKTSRNFQVYPDAEVDCYYRIDFERSDSNASDRLIHHFNGVCLYTAKMIPRLKASNQFRALRGTIFSFVNRCNYELASNLITSQDHREILDRTIIFLKDSALFRRQHIAFLRLYTKLYGLGLYKIKGFNFGSKKVFMLI